MPKEITHINLAKAVFDHLPGTSRFHRAIQAHFNLFLYGAVAPDTFYYYLAGPKRAFIQGLSRQIHADHPPPLDLVIDFLNYFKFREPAAIAFAAGICCHLITDTVFHPMVYYFCGIKGLHPGAETRHRAFETALDVHFWYLETIKSTRHTDPLSCIFDIPQKTLIHLLSILFRIHPDREKKRIRLALQYHEKTYRLFRHPWAFRFFNTLHRFGLGIHSRQVALIYPVSRPVALSFFNHTMRYKHPVTGKIKQHLIDDLVQKNLNQTLDLLAVLESMYGHKLNKSRLQARPGLPHIKPCFSQHNFEYWYGLSNLLPMVYKEIVSLTTMGSLDISSKGYLRQNMR